MIMEYSLRKIREMMEKHVKREMNLGTSYYFVQLIGAEDLRDR